MQVEYLKRLYTLRYHGAFRIDAYVQWCAIGQSSLRFTSQHVRYKRVLSKN